MADEPTLHHGDRSADGWVEYAQGLLNTRNAGDATVDTLPLDGAFDDRMIRVVYRFQQDHRLKVDGVIGDQTWAALRGADAVAPHADGHRHAETDHGMHAVWHEERPPEYSADSGVMTFVLVNVGDVVIPSNAYSLDIDITGDSGTVNHRPPLSMLDMDSLPGELVMAGIDDLRDQLGAGDYTYRAVIPDELRGGEHNGRFTIG